MKNLDDILRNPRAHSAEVPREQVNAWGEEALALWSAEQQGTTATKKRAFREVLASALFWGSFAAGAVMLLSVLWDRVGIPMDRLREMPDSLFSGIAEHPLWLGGVVLCLGIWFTRPLRELLLD